MFTKGQEVQANYSGEGEWFRGKIAQVNSDGTYDILYDDGESEQGVTEANIRALDYDRVSVRWHTLPTATPCSRGAPR